MTIKEIIREYSYKYFMEADFDRDWCEDCPVAEQCQTEQLYYGCGVWEDEMGEDL